MPLRLLCRTCRRPFTLLLDDADGVPLADIRLCPACRPGADSSRPGADLWGSVAFADGPVAFADGEDEADVLENPGTVG
jgi:hypothetical protein